LQEDKEEDETRSGHGRKSEAETATETKSLLKEERQPRLVRGWWALKEAWEEDDQVGLEIL
jgi:hypothetical protein